MAPTLEIASFFLILLGAGALLLRLSQGSGYKLAVVLGVALQGTLLLAASPRNQAPISAAPVAQRSEAGYATSSACKSCHPGEYATWHQSFHRSMTERATPNTVRAPWQEQALAWRGRSYRLFRRGTEYWVSLPDPDHQPASGQPNLQPSVERQVVMTTGSHHYQAFWVEGRRGNELWQFPFVYHFQSQRYIPRDAAFLQPPDADPHQARWNSNCIQCHAVAGQPAHDAKSDRFDTSVVELGIACEACHGPAQAHVQRHQNPITRYRQHHDQAPDSSITNPARLDAEHSAAVCGQCHAYFVPKRPEQWWQSGFSQAFLPGELLDGSRLVLDYDRDKDRSEPLISASIDSVFFRDGTMRVGGREYNGLIRSPCYERGQGERRMSCLSCHELHGTTPTDQLRVEARVGERCLECHENHASNIEAHTHHPAGSSGSNCYNCHMPYTTYALFKGIRSHRITSPSAASSLRHATPNACNLCHLDRSLHWTATWLSNWYQHETLELAGDAAQLPQAVLGLLNGDAATRVLSAYAMGWDEAQVTSGTDWQAPLLAEALDDPYAAVRFVAHRSLTTLPGLADFEYDFIADAPQRRARRAAVQQHARQPAGFTLDQKQVERLIQSRDSTPISISE